MQVPVNDAQRMLVHWVVYAWDFLVLGAQLLLPEDVAALSRSHPLTAEAVEEVVGVEVQGAVEGRMD